jgi:hypothetical protein
MTIELERPAPDSIETGCDQSGINVRLVIRTGKKMRSSSIFTDCLLSPHPPIGGHEVAQVQETRTRKSLHRSWLLCPTTIGCRFPEVRRLEQNVPITSSRCSFQDSLAAEFRKHLQHD